MSVKSTPSTPRPSSPPIAGALGLLAACAVTLIGVAGGLSPEVILLRSIVAGTVTFGLTTGMLMYWRAVSPRQEEDV